MKVFSSNRGNMPNSFDQSSENWSSPQTDHVLYPEDAGKMWIVRQGWVDLFLQRMVNGEYGARRHVTRIAAGQAFFGISMQEHGGVCLIAALHPGTEIECMSLPVFCRKHTLSETQAPVQLLEAWIHALASACNLRRAPREAIGVSPESGPTLRAEEEDISIVASASLVWLRVDSKDVLLFGEESLASCRVFPLSRPGQGWIRLPRNSSVGIAEFDLIHFEDPAWTWLERFHRLIVECLLKKQEREEQAWADEARRQKENDALVAHRALLRLTAPLSAKGKHPLPVVGADPLLTACQAIGKHLGVTFTSVPDLRSNTSARHAVEVIARASAIRHRGVTLICGWWKEDCGPLLAFSKEDQRPLALLPRSSTGYDAFDPVEGIWTRVDGDMASRLMGSAFSFYRSFPQRAIGAGALLRFSLGTSRNDILLVMGMGVVAGLLSLVFPIFVGIIFDEVIPGADRPHLYGLAALLLVAAVATALFALVRCLAVLRIEARVDVAAQAAMWDRLLRLPAPFFRQFSSGDLAIRSLAMNQIRAILTNSTMTSLLAGIFSIFSLALLFFYNWVLALLAVALTVIALSLRIASAFAQLRFTRQTARLRGRIAATLLQFINGISKLRVAGAERRAFAIWAQEFSEQKSFYMQSSKIANALVVFQSVFPLVAIEILFLCSNVGAKGMSTGAFLAFLAAFLQFIFYFMQCTSAVPSILSIVPIFERALPILQTLPEVDAGRSFPGELQGAVEVSHLSFRYESGSPLIIRDVSFAIRPGEFVAFTGPSGSGKSTLLRLLLGFEIPEAGTISYDNQDIAGIDVQALRRQLGVVLQSGRLVSGTILDNIIGSLPLSHDDAWEAARMAGLDRDIKAMPMGLHTFVNDGGGGLSGGQRQRLMIARAIVSKPRILFFDEATSALDNYTESVVSRSLETLLATRVVIAHRLSTIQNADRIYVFDNGRIVQSGNYKELYSQPGLFRELAQRQVV
jgi:NHLM bacteriocin system ABC transporter ATP-binding protein